MTRKKDPETLAALQKAMEKASHRWSPLYRWMWENHDDFVEMLGGERPDWFSLTEAFTERGFANADGTPLRVDTVRQTWWRVQKRYAERQEKVGKGKPPMPTAIPEIRLVEARAPGADVPPVEPAPGRKSDVLARLKDEADERSGRMKRDG